MENGKKIEVDPLDPLALEEANLRADIVAKARSAACCIVCLGFIPLAHGLWVEAATPMIGGGTAEAVELAGIGMGGFCTALAALALVWAVRAGARWWRSLRELRRCEGRPIRAREEAGRAAETARWV